MCAQEKGLYQIKNYLIIENILIGNFLKELRQPTQ